jgi:hypothetical protein
MNMNRLLSLVLVIAVWAIIGPAHADTLLASVDEALKEPIRLVAEWESDRSIALSLVLIVVILGAAIAVIHSLSDKAAKVGAVVLGTLVTTLTAVNNAYFDFDHRQYKAMASQGRQLLTEINIRKMLLADFPVEQKQAREAIFEEIRRQANAIVALPANFKDRAVQGAALEVPARVSEMLVSPALADQSRAPDWISKLPADDENLYFLGISDGRDYVAVREASKGNAYDQARAYLAGQLKTSGTSGGVDSTSAAKYLLDSARVAGTYSTYDRSKSAFRSYTLLSLSKKVAESDLRWYGAKNAQQASPVQQQMLRSAVRTQDAYIPNRKEVMRSQ